jgi:hypothetical protein
MCWLSLSKTMVSSQLKRRVLVQAQSLKTSKGFPNLGFYKNSGKASRFKFVNYEFIGADVPTYGNACWTRFANVLHHVSYLASTHSSAIVTHCLALEFRWEILRDTVRMHSDGWEVRRNAVWWSKLTASVWAASTTNKLWKIKFECQTTRIPDIHPSNVSRT